MNLRIILVKLYYVEMHFSCFSLFPKHQEPQKMKSKDSLKSQL